MMLVGVGTFFYFTCDALVWWHGGSVLELMFGKYIVQFLISTALWMGNPYNVKGSAQNWYGDEPHRANIWIRGWLLFCYVFLWWRALEQIDLGRTLSLSLHIQSVYTLWNGALSLFFRYPLCP